MCGLVYGATGHFFDLYYMEGLTTVGGATPGQGVPVYIRMKPEQAMGANQEASFF